jgi:hypothetical protein
MESDEDYCYMKIVDFDENYNFLVWVLSFKVVKMFKQ